MILSDKEALAIAEEIRQTDGFAELIHEAQPIARLLAIRCRMVNVFILALNRKSEMTELSNEERGLQKVADEEMDMLSKFQPCPRAPEQLHPNTLAWMKERAHLIPRMGLFFLRDRGIDLGVEL